MKSLTRAFTGGEITPELFGYLGLPRFQTGLAKALNFTVLPHGPVQNRAGFSYVLEAKDSTQAVRIYEFTFSTTQTYILEFGHQYVRFYTNGSAVLESAKVITGITQANPGVVSSTGHGFANGDITYLSTIVGMTELNGRFVKVANQTANNFEIQGLDGVNIDTSSYTAYSSAGTAARVYTVATPYSASDLFGLKFTQSADVLSIAHKSYAFRELSRLGAASWVLGVVSFSPGLNVPTAPTLVGHTSWNVTRFKYRIKHSVAAQDTSPQALAFKPDGTKMYVVGNTNNAVYEYNLSVAWDVSTAVYLQNFSVVNEDGTPRDLAFKPDGTKMYVVGNTTDAVNEYDLSTAWDISTAVYLQDFIVSSQDAIPTGLAFKPDGTKMYTVGSTNDAAYEYNLSVAWDVSTAVYLQNFSVATQEIDAHALAFKPDGTKMYVVGVTGDDVNEYDLSAAWDISTAVYLRKLSVADQEISPTGLAFKPGGAKMYVVGNAGDAAYEYVFENGFATPVTLKYKYTAIAAETLEESLASPEVVITWDLTAADYLLGIVPVAVVGASRYKIYREINGIYGYIGETKGAELIDANITPDVSVAPPEAYDPFNSTGNYPNAVGYAESRRVFAGTDNSPQGFWLTASQAPSNLTYSIPLVDSDAIVGTIYANQMNRVRHIVSLSGLVLLTAGGEWTMNPDNAADILTPSTISPKQHSAEGASSVRPLAASNAILYVHENQKRVMELKYRAETGKLTPVDVSIIAPHLFDGYTIVDSAYTKSPHKVCWFVRSDGVLLGMTYVPEYNIMAWHQHSTTNGTFESVAAVKEGSRDVLYAVIKRTVNARTVRYIERLADRGVSTLAEHVITDSAISYTGSAATVLYGFEHLQGESVVGLDNGAVVGPFTVSAGGTVTLPAASSGNVHLGLSITADLQTLPFAMETVEAFGQGLKVTVDRVYLRVYESSGMQAGPTFDKLRAYPARSNENYDTPPALKTGVVDIGVDSKWNDSGQLAIRQPDPLPITVSSLTLEVAKGG